MPAYLETRKLSFFILAAEKLHVKELKRSIFHNRALLSLCVLAVTRRSFIITHGDDAHLTMSTFSNISNRECRDPKSHRVSCRRVKPRTQPPLSPRFPPLERWSGGRWAQLPRGGVVVLQTPVPWEWLQDISLSKCGRQSSERGRSMAQHTWLLFYQRVYSPRAERALI